MRCLCVGTRSDLTHAGNISVLVKKRDKLNHFVFTIEALGELSLSLLMMEDTIDLKTDPLFGTGGRATQGSSHAIFDGIVMGKDAKANRDPMAVRQIKKSIPWPRPSR